MGERKHLYLIDHDVRRRATICHSLAGSAIYVEPFESAAEIRAPWPRAGAILLEDREGQVPALFEQMTADDCWLPVICFAEQAPAPKVAQAILQGAVGYLEWPFGPEEVTRALAAAERTTLDFGSFKLRQARARGRVRKLTSREREVLGAMAEGLSNRQIGERLAISPRTVEIHRSNMLNKVGAGHTSEAIRIAIEASMID